MIQMENVLDGLLKDKKETAFPKGSVILRPDHHLKHIYYIQKGWVRQYSISDEGEELTINIYRPGSYFSVVLILTNNENLHYFEAMTRVHAVKIMKNEFLDYLKKDPEALFDLTRRVSIGLTSLVSRMESLVFGTAVNKVSANLYLNASRFGGKIKRDGTRAKNMVKIDFPLTHRQISTMSGLTRETVSIVMMKLKKQGIITYRRQEVVVLDMDRLFELSSLNQ